MKEPNTITTGFSLRSPARLTVFPWTSFKVKSTAVSPLLISEPVIYLLIRFHNRFPLLNNIDYFSLYRKEQNDVLYGSLPFASGIHKLRARQISVGSPNQVAGKELGKIVDAAKRKAAKDYPINTSLIIVFDDDWFFQRAIDDANLDTFVKKYILELDLRFSISSLGNR